MKRHLIVYAKCPLPHNTKTRLGATLGHVEAAGVYARLLYAYLFDLLATVAETARIELSLGHQRDVPFFTRAFPELLVRPQVHGDLGARMAASFDQAFAEGADAVVLTGSDIPGLNGALVQEAFARLETDPAVIGPAEDGGYYLLGLRAPGADLFSDIPWSTADVLACTEARARAHDLTLTRLPLLADIDVEEDYAAWIGSEHFRKT
ncbi:MAG: TIGR04282 family arsenosugar biosynthesis glycosyltransferase [Anaerolineae bacterium]